MATRRVLIQGIASTRGWTLLPSFTSRSTRLVTLPRPYRSFGSVTRLHASLAPGPASTSAAATPSPPPAAPPTTEDPDHDTVRHAAFLGEGDSNDGHDAVQEAYGDPAPALDATHSAYLGEADSDDGFEAHKDVEGREQPPVDASQSAFLGEGDSDDGFEGRRAVYPEEGDHKIEDTSGSGIHGQSGEGDTFEEDGKKR